MARIDDATVIVLADAASLTQVSTLRSRRGQDGVKLRSRWGEDEVMKGSDLSLFRSSEGHTGGNVWVKLGHAGVMMTSLRA